MGRGKEEEGKAGESEVKGKQINKNQLSFFLIKPGQACISDEKITDRQIHIHLQSSYAIKK